MLVVQRKQNWDPWIMWPTYLNGILTDCFWELINIEQAGNTNTTIPYPLNQNHRPLSCLTPIRVSWVGAGLPCPLKEFKDHEGYPYQTKL
ncbi:hypothetical protein AVEN_41667-1 [Araneus ventricosus]|uniref:Uncharacterized protein n=1 Tax=Araneus ventricosus TaxID=182803 RepID=A0A4Y2I270_ARAVE|nr:hypothetical protein AVEN_41667-1 [Araneus ventricosus]